MAVWLSGNVVGHINEVTLRRAGLVLRWVIIRWYTVIVFNQAAQANSAWSSLSGLAKRVLAIVTATAREEYGEFCITVGPVTRTVGILI